MSASARFALALDGMDGVGRVTAGRLLAQFPTHEALLGYPREQVLARIKGMPRAEDLVTRLFDRDAMQARFDAAEALLADLAARRVAVLTPPDPAWPAGLADLPRAARPFLLYTYGRTDAMALPGVAILARPPLSPPAFEEAQALVRHALGEAVVPVTGAAHGVDVVVHKLAGDPPRPSVLVASCGLARIPPPLRPVVSAVVRAGGLAVAPFAMRHGPFDHDDRERALVQAALARACVFVEPKPDTPEWHALTWALDAGRAVFGLPADGIPLPAAVHLVRSAVDFDWVVAAAQVDGAA